MGFDFKNIKWGISEKKDGAMNIRLPLGDNICLNNRRIFFDKLGIDIENVVATNLVHGVNIYITKEDDRGKIILETDGLVTNKKNVFLTVTASDCLPIYFFDPVLNVIGLAHAGWRGVVKNIVIELINKLKNEFNSDPKNICVYVGPHLQLCHFEIKNDIISQFDEKYISYDKNKITVNLSAIVRNQLVASGILLDNISISSNCTYCNADKYFSYRRDKSEQVQSMVAYIGLV